MKAKLFDGAIVGNAQEAMDFIGNILESSTEYSMIGKDLDGKILLSTGRGYVIQSDRVSARHP